MAKTSSKPTKPKLLLKKGKYQVFEELGRGSFGIVSRAYDTINKRDCAIKQEKNRGKGTASNEDQIYAKIGELPGFLQKYDYFTEGPTRYVVFNLLDDDLLKRMRQQPGKKLDLKSVIMIAIQMFKHIKGFHDKGFIHRDIKPENTAMGFGQDAANVYFLDLGISKQYRDYMKKNHGRVGNARYASLNSHLYRDLSRRDDLETIAYNLIYVLTGSLPWWNITGWTSQDRWKNIYDMKSIYSTSKLCKDLPEEFRTILKYSRKLKFNEVPNYDYLVKLLEKLAEKKGFELDNIYPWTKNADPAMMLKKKKIEEEEQRIKRQTELQRRKILNRKFKYPSTRVDTFFSENSGLSLDEKRALIAENMRHSVAFPCLAPPLFPPPKESQQPIVAAGSLIEYIQATSNDDRSPVTPNDHPNAAAEPQPMIVEVEVSKSPAVEPISTVNVEVAQANPADANVVDTNAVDNMIFDTQVPNATDAAQAHQTLADVLDNNVSKEVDPAQNMVIDNTQQVQGAPAVEAMDIAKSPPSKPQSDVVMNTQEAETKEKNAPCVVVATSKKKKSKSKKKRQAAEAQQAESGPKKKTRKEQQEEMVALAEAQAKREVEIRTEAAKHKEQVECMNRNMMTLSVGGGNNMYPFNAQINSPYPLRVPYYQRHPKRHLPPFEQKKPPPNQPWIAFSPTFGVPFPQQNLPEVSACGGVEDGFFLF